MLYIQPSTASPPANGSILSNQEWIISLSVMLEFKLNIMDLWCVLPEQRKMTSQTLVPGIVCWDIRLIRFDRPTRTGHSEL